MEPRKQIRKKIIITAVVLIFAAFITIFICDRIIKNAATNKIYTDLQSIPFNNVGLLLGTGKYLSSGHENPYYRYRITAAGDLLKSSKK